MAREGGEGGRMSGVAGRRLAVHFSERVGASGISNINCGQAVTSRRVNGCKEQGSRSVLDLLCGLDVEESVGTRRRLERDRDQRVVVFAAYFIQSKKRNNNSNASAFCSCRVLKASRGCTRAV